MPAAVHITAIEDVVNKSMNARVLAMNIIRHIGDRVLETGRPLDEFSSFSDIIGSPSDEITDAVMRELEEKGIIRVGDVAEVLDGKLYYAVNLSLDGWERYEAEKQGNFYGDYGFLAMKFGDVELEEFVRDILNPTLNEHLGMTLRDMRDVAQAGIIDDIMRVTIRDAKFVIADLTHDNLGAYWEAGYAEGLGKPVIYICEKSKFDEEETHFDVNHCTTVMWSADAPDDFRNELIAVLRRSLSL